MADNKSAIDKQQVHQTPVIQVSYPHQQNGVNVIMISPGDVRTCSSILPSCATTQMVKVS